MNHTREVKCKMKNKMEMLLISLLPNKILPGKTIEQIACNTRAKNEKHMLIVMDKFTHEVHLLNP